MGASKCEAEGAIDFSIEGATATIDCLGDSGDISCTYSNFLGPRPIPTLSEWGLIAMAGVLGVIGLLALRRRKLAV